jgi:ABC-type uncharacterized transport system involved in gliding motility auxiliary subunit
MSENRGKTAGVLDRAAASIARINRRHLAWGGVALAAIILLAVNLIASSALRDARFDLTKDRLFTISDGTRKALRAIDEPIDIQVYYSKKLGEAAPTYAKSFERVRTMLEQYSGISHGKLRITFLDPEPFSDAEDRAVAAGLRGVRLNQEGEMGYFGIVGSNSTDAEASLPFLAAERERFLEYDVTKLIVKLANQAKSDVGLISGIPIEGSPGMPMMGRPPSQPLLILEQIREFFEVKSLPKDLKEIPSDIGVLMLVQPEGLSAEATYAIDQFALAGGKVLAFVDPVPEMQRQGGPMMMMGLEPPDLAQFGKLLKAWGVEFDTSKVAADIARARRVQFGSGARASVTDYVLWLGLDRRNLDERDVLAANIERLNFASAGILAKAADATTEFSPVVRTTSEAMEIPSDSVSIMPDAVGLLRSYKRGGKALTIAARVSGEAKSAFPEGRPAPPAEEKKDGDAAKDKADTTAPAAEKKADAAPAKPHLANGKVNLIIVADSDFLQDQFWVEVREFLGQQIAVPNSHNGAFVLGALENLSGTDALISLRARGVTDRPFELVNELRRDAEQRFRSKEQVLTARLKEVQTKLAGLEKQGSTENLVLTEKDRQEIEKFRGDMLAVRRDLREVKRELRKDIDRLDGVLKFANIAAVPLLVGLAGIGWAYRRRRGPGPQSNPTTTRQSTEPPQ